MHARLVAGGDKSLSLPWLRPSLFASPLLKVELLGGSVPITHTATDADGMTVHGISVSPPAPSFNCTVFGCSCKGMGDYYGIGPAPGCTSFGCAPKDAQDWWIDTMGCTTAAYANTTVHPGCSDGKCGPARPSPSPQTPASIGLVLKLSF